MSDPNAAEEQLSDDRMLDRQIGEWCHAQWEERRGINQPPPLLVEVETEGGGRIDNEEER